jgi:putative transposase
MRQLNGVYTQRFNRRHQRVGHVFQGRYKDIIVQKDTYLLELARYIVLNPARARMVRSANEWRWSSYRATAGFSEAPAWLAIDRILTAFAARRGGLKNAIADSLSRAETSPRLGNVSRIKSISVMMPLQNGCSTGLPRMPI